MYFTSETFRLQQRGQLVDRINKAVEQLSSDKLDLNLGGIYQLGRIAADSERDRWPMIQVLMAHVERGAPIALGLSCNASQPFDSAGIPNQKVQSIVRILRERDTSIEGTAQRVSMERSNFSYVDFSGAEFKGAFLANDDLRGAILADADLEGVTLNDSLLNHANMSRANLAAAQLQRTCLLFSQLTGVSLRNAHLEHANLRDVVDASGADFAGALLDGADFSGVNLTNAKGLTAPQLAKAKIDCETKLPTDLASVRSTLNCGRGDASRTPKPHR